VTSIHEIYVPPVGPKNARIMLLGESPGRKEVEAKTPFIGPAGKLLDEFLAAAAISRADCYITNTVKFLPTGVGEEKDEYFFTTIERGRGKDKSVTRIPTKAFMDGIIELVAEIKEVKPNVIVPMGNYALWALTQKTGIFNYRGSILESEMISGMPLKVIPTVHPAWYIRSFAERAKLLGNWDFMRIAEQAKFPEVRRKIHNFIVNPTPEQINQLIERYSDPSLDHITCDTEWYGPEKLAYVGVADNELEAACIVPDSMLAYRAIKTILGSPIPKVWQNAMFDAVALWRQGIQVENVAYDTMLAWSLCWGNVLKEPALKRTNGLDMIGSVLTEEPYYKEDVEFVGKDDERGQIYCCTDCVVTDEAFQKMEKLEFPYTQTRKGFEISMTVMNTFIRAAQVGLLVDMTKLLDLREYYLSEADDFEAKLSERMGRKFNPRSWPQAQQIVYEDLGLGKRFSDHSTDQLRLMDIAATLNAEGGQSEIVETLEWIIRARQNRNICSRYITPKIVDKDGRTRSFWNLAGTKNGRLSTTIPWWPGVALQTMPEEAREFCIPDPGCVFVGWDLAQAEARDVAVRTRNFSLLEAMDSGIDIHCMLAPILNRTYEALMEEVARVGKDACKPRQLLKITRHASNYDLSFKGLKLRINKEYLDTKVGVDEKIAKRLSLGYLEQNPGLQGWWEEVYQAIKNGGSLENAFGRRRNSYGRVLRHDHEHKDFIAFCPQSDIADLTTLSIAEVDKPDWTTPLLHMHDGGLFQVHESMKDDAIELVRRGTDREFYIDGIPVKIPVDVKVGYDWRNLKKVK
jgi:DNA polymerase I-like protein with 3'-5' exonuclease and polymerase domains/uracil-DNA glycosylase